MAVHSKLVTNKNNAYQVFSNDTSLSDAYTFADGDFIDFEASLGRPAKNVSVIVRGTYSVTLLFNTKVKVVSQGTTGPDDLITMPDGMNNTNQFKLSSSGAGTAESFDFPDTFPIANIKIVDVTGSADATNNLTCIGF